MEPLKARVRLWSEAIGEAFITLLPITLIGAVSSALLHNNQEALFALMDRMAGSGWQPHVAAFLRTTMGAMGLLSVSIIAIKISNKIKERDKTFEFQALAGTIGTCAFLLAGADDQDQSLGYVSIFRAIVVGILSAELLHVYHRIIPRRHIKDFLHQGFSVRRSIYYTAHFTLVCGTIYTAHRYTITTEDWIQTEFSALLEYLCHANVPSPILHCIFILLNQTLWTFGLNGGQIIIAWTEAGHSACLTSQVALNGLHQVNTSFLNSFCHLGGAGATWGLIVAALLGIRERGLRSLCIWSTPIALLNVNELLLFGLPLIFNRRLWVPFMLAPLACMVTTYLVFELVGVRAHQTAVPWSTPIFLSGYLMTESWWGPMAQLIGVCVSAITYAPFLRNVQKAKLNERRQVLKHALEEIMQPARGTEHINKSDTTGEIARSLLHDFIIDLGSDRVSLVYQAQHDAAGRVVGAEALLRWTHPIYGPLPTAAIIVLAEEGDTIHQIGRWVLKRVCLDICEWQKAQQLDMKISMNMSPLQLLDPEWVPFVRTHLSRHGLHPSVLGLEITEGREISNNIEADRALHELQRLGTPLSLDDFGMGCTSLLYMQRFAMHSIKLDAQLTRFVSDNLVNQDIIRTITRLGRARGVLVVAEFVESETQRALLEELGCNHFQGWLYTKGLSAAEFMPYVRLHNGR